MFCYSFYFPKQYYLFYLGDTILKILYITNPEIHILTNINKTFGCLPNNFSKIKCGNMLKKTTTLKINFLYNINELISKLII